ncbi:polyserase-2-like [Saccostrea cucullata]|uniref:polyserase-2-like n=1 Tax=Saccostrea cuccullata TaxID=36930 RepID=UPI002ED637FD
MKVAVFLCVFGLSVAVPMIRQPAREILGSINRISHPMDEQESRIVGGQTASTGEWPWQISLQIGTSHICGGSLISANRVLTAAHCVEAYSNRPTTYEVEAGITRVSATGERRTVTRVNLHPQYSGSSAGYPNDIAVLELSSAFPLGSTIALATLPSNNEDFLSEPQNCWMTGWGRTNVGTSGSTSNSLMEAQIRNIGNTECANRWSGINGASIFSSHICLYEEGKSACSGDSGGPYVCEKNGQWRLAGVTSWGISTCSGSYPSVYTRVSSYLSWISNYLFPDGLHRIVNGQEASPGEWPWQVSLQYRQFSFLQFSHICGGSLIRPNWVLTAAHCVDGMTSSNLRIEAGIDKVSENGATRSISRIIMLQHPQYSSSAAGYPNDIALLELSSSFTVGGDIQLATLPTNANEDFLSITDCYITGWGRTSGGGSTSDVLMEAQMRNIANTECATRWSSVNGAAIFDTHICPFEQNKSACNGDSGGPYVCKKNGDYMLAGVTSWGISTCDGTYPSVYTRVSKYLDWMANYI